MQISLQKKNKKNKQKNIIANLWALVLLNSYGGMDHQHKFHCVHR